MASIVSLVFMGFFFKVFTYEVCYWPLNVQPKPKPENCAEVFNPGKDVEGIYKLEVEGLQIEAYCIPDPIHGPAWTIIQRRMDGTIDFYRDFEDYENGFGNIYGEYWLGLKNMHKMLNSGLYELWVQLVTFDGTYRFARYGKFHISGASEQYIIHVYDYFGDAGDSLYKHNGDKFETRDRMQGDHCPKHFRGAWWFHDCHNSHLNGEYIRDTSERLMGVTWGYMTELYGPMKYAHMAIRPAKYSSYLL